MIEVELKFEVATDIRKALQVSLDTLPSVRCFEERTSTDTYYDTAMYDAFRRAIFMRVRNSTVLEIKFHEQDDPDHLYSTERVFPLNADRQQVHALNELCSRLLPAWRDVETIEQLFQTNDLRVFVSIEKHRMRYTYQDITLCLDDVSGLGTFLEIETLCETHADIESARMRLHSVVSQLAYTELRPVHIGYVELWLRLHLPQVYAQGKYQA